MPLCWKLVSKIVLPSQGLVTKINLSCTVQGVQAQDISRVLAFPLFCFPCLAECLVSIGHAGIWHSCIFLLDAAKNHCGTVQAIENYVFRSIVVLLSRSCLKGPWVRTKLQPPVQKNESNTKCQKLQFSEWPLEADSKSEPIPMDPLMKGPVCRT